MPPIRPCSQKEFQQGGIYIMCKILLKSTFATVGALFLSSFILPQQAQAQTEYELKLCGRYVSDNNCNDLSIIPGVKGKVKYDPESYTLTLENATIHTTDMEDEGFGIWNKVSGLTICLIGNNTITTENSGGIINGYGIDLTFAGNGKLTVIGSTTAKKDYQYGIVNRGTITVSDCNLEVSGGAYGLSCGYWMFENCTVRAKGDGHDQDSHAGSFSWVWGELPKFTDCAITSPTGAKWKDFSSGNTTNYTLSDAEGKPITDWVVITPSGTSINTPSIYTAVKQGIYSLSGQKLNGTLKEQAKGLYIVNGKKVVKQ